MDALVGIPHPGTLEEEAWPKETPVASHLSILQKLLYVGRTVAAK